ncbi:hypothetical protein J8V57_17410 [Xenorhabdus sp. PB61.4]|uniref:hypothetical protein n=1 Tax=Xenorhabdus sp. PB61.4 TaxID=2788940 RepID=UPI001E4FF88F|nr:hypothetical protein [Xenorhabdus sp. PB61.4]MCC8368019.1 hypothetical protein [Xenorhabdus sp. PB61.4]
MNPYSLKRKIFIFPLMFIVLFFPLYHSYANPAVAIVARPIITRVFQSIVTRRAGMVAANDAVMLNTVRSGTMRYVGRVAANDSVYKLAKVSSLRHAKDISWVSLALSSGAITLLDLNVNGNDKVSVFFEPTAVKLKNGRYAINVNGKTKIVSYKPSLNNPVIYTYSYNIVNPIEKVDVYENDKLSNDYRYYYKSNDGGLFMSNDLPKLAEHHAYQDLVKYDTGNKVTNETVEIDDKKYEYLIRRVDVETKYLRHSIGEFYVEAEVRVTRNITEFKYDFDVLTEYFTGTETIKIFNKPDLEKDYDYYKDTSVSSPLLLINREYTEKKDDDTQVGTIADLNLNLYKNKTLPLQNLATLFNGLLLEAALQQGYDGVPFSQENPITETEIQTALNELGVDRVTFSDLLAKAGAGNVIKVDFEENPAPNPKPSPNPKPRPKLDEETDLDAENIQYPELDMPTAEQILAPYKLFFPFLQDFTMPSRSAQCPVWDINIPYMNFRGKIDSHCPLIEENRGVIESIFSLVWAFVALRRLLSA